MIDVLGLDVDDAASALRAAGHSVEIVETRTPKPVILSGPRRVIRQVTAADGVVHLVVARRALRPSAGGRGWLRANTRSRSRRSIVIESRRTSRLLWMETDAGPRPAACPGCSGIGRVEKPSGGRWRGAGSSASRS